MTLTLYLAIYVIVNLYVIFQVNRWIRRITTRLPARLIPDIILVVLALIPPVAAYAPEDPLLPTLEAAGDKWTGFLVYLALALLIFHLFRFFVWLFGGRAESREARDRAARAAKEAAAAGKAGETGAEAEARAARAARKAQKQHATKPHAPWTSTLVLGLCVLFSLTLNVYGNVHAHDVHVKDYNIALEKKTVTAGELSVALIGDLHLGSTSHLDQIESMVEKINDAKPDVVLIAGDVFNGSYDNVEDPEKYAAALSKLSASQGTYAVYGDYDVKERLMTGFPVTPADKAVRDPRMKSFMESAGFTILEDQTVYVNGVQIVGRRDARHPENGKQGRMGISRLVSSLDTKMPVLVLQHEAEGLEKLAEGGVDLTLCGGTHNGQFLPLNWIWHFFSENSYGLKRLHGAYSLTTCGIGYTGPPIRVGTHCEVSLIHLSY